MSEAGPTPYRRNNTSVGGAVVGSAAIVGFSVLALLLANREPS
jgi:hypothetical protein